MRLLIILSLALHLVSCEQSQPSESKKADEVITSLYQIQYADHFKLAKSDDKVILSIINPENHAVEKTVEIIPSASVKIISLSSTINGMLVNLNQTKSLVGISNIEYIYDKKIKKRFKNKKITEYGDETSQSVEKIIASGANIIFHSGFGDEFPNQAQLEKIGITIIPIYDWREEDPLGKAEWIKLIGAITKSENEAMNFFSAVEEDYNILQKLTKNLKNNPKVISGNMLGDIWYAPVGDSYVAQLIKDAGGDYVYKDTKGTGSLALSIETILKDNAKTDIWINPGIDTKKKVLKLNPHAKQLACFNNMFCYSKKMNKFWEQSAAQPNLFLSDLIHIFHPEIKQIKDFNFYKKIK